MRNIVSISLPDELLKRVRREMKLNGLSSSEITRKALAEYLFKEDFARLRKKAALIGAAKGKLYTDDELFKMVS